MAYLVLSLEVVHHPALAGEVPSVEDLPGEAASPEGLPWAAFPAPAPAPAAATAEC
jgi:hypothetical protein